jgi:crotonobetaine/carnitine-CoA ligase
MTEAWALRDLTIARVLARQRERHGHRLFLTELWTGRRWTYAQMDALVDRMAQALRAAGVDKGHHVGLLLGNSAEHLALFFALGKLGAVAVPINTAARGELLRYYFTHADATVAIVDEVLVERLEEVLPSLDRVGARGGGGGGGGAGAPPPPPPRPCRCPAPPRA